MGRACSSCDVLSISTSDSVGVAAGGLLTFSFFRPSPIWPKPFLCSMQPGWRRPSDGGKVDKRLNVPGRGSKDTFARIGISLTRRRFMCVPATGTAILHYLLNERQNESYDSRTLLVGANMYLYSV